MESKKGLGQHFSQSDSLVRDIVKALGPRAGETIVEIGPGHGELTFPLVAACAKATCKVIAIEKDSTLIKPITGHTLYDSAKLTIHEGDALEVLPRVIEENVSPLSSYKIVGNIPYYITGHLLRVIGNLARRPTRCVFTLQKEVAERIVAGPPRATRLSASVQLWAEPTIARAVSRNEFKPVPKVDSAVIVLTTKTGHSLRESYYEDYFRLVKILFQQPRKTITNNLLDAYKIMGGAEKNPRDAILEKLQTLHIAPTARPQELSPELILGLAELFTE